MSDSIDLKSNTNYVYLKDTNDNIAVPRTSLSAVDLTAGNGIRVLGNMIYTADATAEDIIYGTGASGVVTPAKLKEAIDDGFLANPDIATVDAILSGSTGQMIDPNGLKSALTVAQAADVTTLGSTTMDGDLSALNYTDTFTLTGTNATNKYGFGINGAGTEDETNYPKYADGLKYLFIADMKLAGGNFTSIEAMADGGAKEMLIDGGSLSDYNWRRFAFEFSSKMAYFVFNISNGGSVQLKNVRQYEVTALTDDAIKALAGFENPDDFEYSHIIDQNMINPWLQIIDMGASPEVLVYPGLSYKVNAQNNNVKLSVPSIPANKSGLDSYVELYVGGEGSVAVQRPLVLGSTITPYSTNQCTVKFRDGRAVLTIDEVSQDYVVTVTSGVEGDALSGSLYYGLVYSTANQIAFNSGLDGQEIELPASTIVSRSNFSILGNGPANTIITGSYWAHEKSISYNDLTFSNVKIYIGDSWNTYNTWDMNNCIITGCTEATNNSILFPYLNGTLSNCTLTGNTAGISTAYFSSGTISNCLFSDNYTGMYTLYVIPRVGVAGCTVSGSTFYNNHPGWCDIVIYTGTSNIFSDCVINTAGSGDNRNFAFNILCPSGASGNTGLTLSGSTVNANITVSNGNGRIASLTFANDNIFTFKITGTGLTTLTATSVLDLSNNTHAAVASGGTVSAAAGAKIIALGGNTVTISANTSGSYLLNNGTITSDVYIVTTSGSSTGSGSLIYGMTSTNYSNILFDSSVDGNTISLTGNSTVSRPLSIIGNDPENTVISGGTITSNQNVFLSNAKLTNNMRYSIQDTDYKYSNGINLSNCTVSGYSTAVNYGAGFTGGCVYKVRSCVFENNTNMILINYNFDNNQIIDCVFRNNSQEVVNVVISGSNSLIQNTIFDSGVGVSWGMPLITGSTIGKDLGTSGYPLVVDCDIYRIIVEVGRSARLAGNNKIRNAITGSIATLNLVAGSTLDISSSANSVVVYGSNPTTSVITGTTINVVASTASDAAIGGTATVLYNDNGVTKSRTLSGGGAGYIMRNNGAWGVPVTVASGTASGSLYDRLVNGTATDITFAPVVDGSTVTLVSGTTTSHATSINGIKGSSIISVADTSGIHVVGGNLTISDCLLKCGVWSSYVTDSKAIQLIGCTASGITETHKIGSQDGQQVVFGPATLIKDCVFDNLSYSWGWGAIQTGAIESCRFMNMSLGATSSDGRVVTRLTGSPISNSLYYNNQYNCLANGSSSTVLVSGCTFADNRSVIHSGSFEFSTCSFDNSNITVGSGYTVTFSGTNILNSTVSGAGSIVFADGATVTSTDGNGTVSCKIHYFDNNSTTLENIKITGITASGDHFLDYYLYNTDRAHIKNCLITGNTQTSSVQRLIVTNGHKKAPLYITGSTITNNVSAMIYPMFGCMIFEDVITDIPNIPIYQGNLVLKGNCSVRLIQPINNSATTGIVVFAPDSVVTVSSIGAFPASSGGQYIVGIYDENESTAVPSGTATVVLNGTTVTISGSGTTIDSTGLHS